MHLLVHGKHKIFSDHINGCLNPVLTYLTQLKPVSLHLAFSLYAKEPPCAFLIMEMDITESVKDFHCKLKLY